MTTKQEQETIIAIAMKELDYWADLVREAEAVVEKAKGELGEAADDYMVAKEFLDLLLDRYGRPKAKPSQVFTGMGLQDAILLVIEQKGQAQPQEIIAELEAGGFKIGEHPLRRLHGALLSTDKAVKDRSGTWRWVGSAEQKPMPLGTETKERPMSR